MAPPAWVILRREASASADLPQGTAFSLVPAVPPRVTTVALHPSVCAVEPDPNASARDKFPRVLAADPSGLLLVLTPPPLSERDDGEVSTLRLPNGVEHSIRLSRVPRPRYVVCDVSSCAASPVPYDPDDFIFDSYLGVIAAPGGGGRFMVVELLPYFGGSRVSFLCFSSDTGSGERVKKTVANPKRGLEGTFSDDVVSHGGKLWWVDNVSGLLGYDPFADEPTMEYVEIPEGDVQRGHGCGDCSEMIGIFYRLVQLSNGAFRCLEMCGAIHGAPKVFMRTLADPTTSEWTLEYEASLSEIWAGDTYKAAGLPEKPPVLVLIHPKNQDVVHFALEERLFGVDMRPREVVGCQPFEGSLATEFGIFSSSLLVPFELPPAFSTGCGVSGEKQRPPKPLPKKRLRSMVVPVVGSPGVNIMLSHASPRSGVKRSSSTPSHIAHKF